MLRSGRASAVYWDYDGCSPVLCPAALVGFNHHIPLHTSSFPGYLAHRDGRLHPAIIFTGTISL